MAAAATEVFRPRILGLSAALPCAQLLGASARIILDPGGYADAGRAAIRQRIRGWTSNGRRDTARS
jgi:hypothetical protein